MDTLDMIGKKYNTDKASGQHGYLQCYEELFDLQNLRNEKLRILEIGVSQGGSIRMWEEYFSNSMIYAIDNGTMGSHIVEHVMDDIRSDRVVPFVADQASREDLQRFIDKNGSDFDIIVDDGLHFQEHQQISLGFLFRHLVSGGLYIVEDIALPVARYKDVVGIETCWGIKDKKSFRDSTFMTLLDFVDIDIIDSEYMTSEEMSYLNTHVAQSKIFNGLDIRFIFHGKSSSFISIRKKS